jgi:ribosomal protein S27E
MQIEGIATLNADEYLLSAEINSQDAAALYKLTPSMLSIGNVESDNCSVFPNPTSDFIKVECPDFSSVDIYNEQGVLQKTYESPFFNVSELGCGPYFLLIKNRKKEVISMRKLLIN